MSLIQLLTVGRSLGSVRNEPNRYRMAQQSLLPKFGREVKADAAAAGPPPMAKTIQEERNMIAVEEDKSKAPMSTPPSSRGRWLGKNPFGRRSAAPGAGLVQAELTLAAVRPVRNDLSATDLELVPARPRAVPPPAITGSAKPASQADVTPAAPGPAEAPPERGSFGVFLNRIRSRLFSRA